MLAVGFIFWCVSISTTFFFLLSFYLRWSRHIYDSKNPCLCGYVCSLICMSVEIFPTNMEGGLFFFLSGEYVFLYVHQTLHWLSLTNMQEAVLLSYSGTFDSLCDHIILHWVFFLHIRQEVSAGSDRDLLKPTLNLGFERVSKASKNM